ASGRTTGRAGLRIPMLSGALLGALGFALLGRLGPGTPYVSMLPAFILIPAGMGFAIPAITTAILSSVDRSRSGTAAAVLNAARQTGGAFGVAIFGSLIGSGPAQIVHGLGISALICTCLLIVSTLLVWVGIHPAPRDFIGHSEAASPQAEDVSAAP